MSVNSPKLPNFFVVGAPKAGTTSLYSYLDQHPQVFMCPLKEPNYFADEMRFENFDREDRARMAREMRSLREYLRGDLEEKRFSGLVSEWDDYVRLFRGAGDQTAIGEASPCYLWSKTAANNIAARVPQAKIVMQLRNPVERAFSQYLHMLMAGHTRKSFNEHIVESLRPTKTKFTGDWLIAFGEYHDQVLGYLRTFPRSRIHISLYDDFQLAPQRLMSELFAFLGVNDSFEVDSSERHLESRIPNLIGPAYLLKKVGIWPYLRKLVPNSLTAQMRSLTMRSRSSLTIEPSDRALLIEHYRESIGKLSALLDRDLSAWLDPAPSRNGKDSLVRSRGPNHGQPAPTEKHQRDLR